MTSLFQYSSHSEINKANLAEEEVNSSWHENEVPSDGGEIDTGATETAFCPVFLAKPSQLASTTYSCLKYKSLLGWKILAGKDFCGMKCSATWALSAVWRKAWLLLFPTTADLRPVTWWEESKMKRRRQFSRIKKKNLGQSLPLSASSATAAAYIQTHPTIWAITKKYFANSIDTQKY